MQSLHAFKGRPVTASLNVFTAAIGLAGHGDHGINSGASLRGGLGWTCPQTEIIPEIAANPVSF